MCFCDINSQRFDARPVTHHRVIARTLLAGRVTGRLDRHFPKNCAVTPLQLYS